MQDFSSSSGILTVDLGALSDNYRLFQQKIGAQCKIAGIIKANAYGLGMKEIAQKLTTLGCPQFFVATLEEALDLRKFDAKTPIAVLGGLFQGEEETYIAYNIIPVLNSLDDITRWRKIAKNKETPLPTILHFDTGMNRLGLGIKETKQLFNTPDFLQGLDVQLIMSHFSCADEKDHILTAQQNKKFQKLAERFPAARKSLANSSGMFRDSAYHYDLVRPGYALYGGNPTPETNNPVKDVVTLKARILQLHKVTKGEGVGYGATHIFKQDTTIATVALGYADGFLRAGSNISTLYWQGHPCPIIGRISMDLVSIDLGGLQGKLPHPSDFMDVLGVHQNIDELAATMGTIGYEILTSLGQRYTRRYI